MPGSAPIQSYLWEFGEASFSTLAEIDHTFGPGRYRVRLTVVDDNGMTGTDVTEVTVNAADPEPERPPVCRAAAAPVSGVAPFSVLFQGLYHDPDGRVTEIRWRFEDGSQSDQRQVVRKLVSPGVHRAWFKVIDDQGLGCSDPVEVVVTTSDGQVPPVILSSGSEQARCQEAYRYDADGRASARGSRPVRWQLGVTVGAERVGAPAGMQIDEDTGEVHWVPGPGQAGTQEVTLVAYNQAGTDIQTYTVEVVCADDEAAGGLSGCGCMTRPPVGHGACAVLLVLIGVLRRRTRRNTTPGR
jgi:hypothetical protein